MGALTKKSTTRRGITVMVLLAQGNKSVHSDLGLVERQYVNSGRFHSADLISYGLHYVLQWFSPNMLMYKK